MISICYAIALGIYKKETGNDPDLLDVMFILTPIFDTVLIGMILVSVL